jgi:hypothetical protein
MKKFLIYFAGIALAVIALALLSDWANMYLVHHSTGNPISKMERLWQSTNDEEIPIMGSSRALGNFYPSELSPKCFNYGVNGMGLKEVLFNLKALGGRNSKWPIILNFDPWSALTEQEKNWVGDYRLAPRSARCKTLDAVPGIRFYGMFRMNLTDYLNSKKAVTKVVDRGAVLLKTSRSEKEWGVINSKLTSWHFEYANWVEKFEQSMGALAPRKVIVVVCPCSSRKTELFTSKDNLKAFLTRISKLSNVRVINYYGSDKFSDGDFTDPTHFNIEGARKFSRMLKKEIGF